MGRVHMFQDRDLEAEECLSYALRYCPARYVANRRMILQYLVPVKLLLGHQPHPLLLSRYDLPELAVLALAVRRGDIRSFNECMSANQVAFVQQGVYLVLEKLKLLVYRNLFKRVAMLNIARGEGQATYPRMRLEAFARALRWLGVEMDLDEIECILANLIGQNLIKAYLHHKLRQMICKPGPIGGAFPNPAAAIAKEAAKARK